MPRIKFRPRQVLSGMAQVDGLAWRAGQTFCAYGVKFGIRVSHARLLKKIAAIFPPGTATSRQLAVERLYSLLAEPSSNRLYSDETELCCTRDEAESIAALEADLNLFVAAHAPRRIFVHAGVVAWKGRAILIPGRSLAGKSTLVAALLHAGATYYSDEFAVLDAQGRVHPYARPIALRAPGTLRGIPHSLASFGCRVGRKPLPVGLVVITRYRPGAGWRPHVISQGEAIIDLFKNTVAARTAPERAFTALRLATQNAAALKSLRGDAQEIAELLLQTCERKS